MLLSSFVFVNVLEGSYTERVYYKDEFKKIRFHLGFGAGIGYDWYPKYSDYNMINSYIFNIRLVQELNDSSTFGLIFLINGIIEDKILTDENTFWGNRFYSIQSLLAGVKLKYKSFIPLTKNIVPYFLVGGGGAIGNFEEYLKIENKLFERGLEVDGISVKGIIGSEIYFLPTFLSLDLGVSFNYNFLLHYYSYDEKVDVSEFNDTEFMINFYIGLNYYVF